MGEQLGRRAARLRVPGRNKENMQTVKNEERSCVIWDTIRMLFKGK